jgi:hypothetical protein
MGTRGTAQRRRLLSSHTASTANDLGSLKNSFKMPRKKIYMRLDGVRNQLPEGVTTAWISSLPRSSAARMAASPPGGPDGRRDEFRQGQATGQWTISFGCLHGSMAVSIPPSAEFIP